MSLLKHAVDLLRQELPEDSPGLKALEVAFLNLEPASSSEEVEKWFGILWERFPKEQHDGNPAPHRSKTICRQRFISCCKKHNKKPDDIVKAIAQYTSNCIKSKVWFCGLDTLLMSKAGNWLDYLEG